MATVRHSRSASQTDPPINDASHQWEEDYRRRARLMTRDYVNPNSTRLTHHRRSRSADARPQYRTPQRIYDDPPDFNSAASELSIHRAQCLDIFYPTNDESRARVLYDTRGSEVSSQLPKPIGLYQLDSLEQFGQSSAASSSFRERNGWRNGNRAPMTPSGMVDPYGVQSLDVRRSTPHIQSLNSVPVTWKRHDYEYLKNSLIMFGEEEASSMSTGLSQQELLDRRRREHTAARRKEKKQRKRIVNLPSSLFPLHSSRQRQQANSSPDRDQQADFHHDYEPPSPGLSRQMLPAPSNLLNQHSARGFAADRDGHPRMTNPDTSAERAPETLPFAKSLRGSMVRK